ncbi:uncharacterized protein LY79DRAFT_545368 [Colletotrichum navitas]|uniref:Uncharacterized protein n=1 Tax=Colletotrichum navitas TaxID=681940 RepID=A0AAD8V7Q1_9PEZI|nr:uncharacterized protein LY79DRAFT_545368 [Colletotrichum navitas]KAK1596089.1 hypothetical protein LY79DRAFT_545368 [Colletotrichum navitas]
MHLPPQRRNRVLHLSKSFECPKTKTISQVAASPCYNKQMATVNLPAVLSLFTSARRMPSFLQLNRTDDAPVTPAAAVGTGYLQAERTGTSAGCNLTLHGMDVVESFDRPPSVFTKLVPRLESPSGGLPPMERASSFLPPTSQTSPSTNKPAKVCNYASFAKSHPLQKCYRPA